MCLFQWWPAKESDPLSILNMGCFLAWPLFIFYNYFNAVFLGPGFVPKDWKPENKEDERKLQFCKICDSFKAPRSHHCRKCNRCVFKMDHHCPWINTCCGHRNHASFVYFLLTAPLGCIHAFIILAFSIYRAIFYNHYVFYNIPGVPKVYLGFIQMLMCIFAAGMAVGVAVAVGILFFLQVMSIKNNKTGIEDWILKKAQHRRSYNKNLEEFVYPYNLGFWNNIKQVIAWSGPVGDGISWNVAEGCDQYTLTVEQLCQKEEKKHHSVQHKVTENYAGAFFPCKFGCKTCCCVPWTEDPRITLYKDEIVQVTRFQKMWLYGEVKVTDETKLGRKCTKGWFPLKCVVINEENIPSYLQDKKND